MQQILSANVIHPTAFVMTCKPPLYMGPEYIKYFSEKTIDVSATLQMHTFICLFPFNAIILCYLFLTVHFSTLAFTCFIMSLWGKNYYNRDDVSVLISFLGGTSAGQSCHLDCWILCKLVVWLPVLCPCVCRPFPQVRNIFFLMVFLWQYLLKISVFHHITDTTVLDSGLVKWMLGAMEKFLKGPLF